jgi:hypothetical protein
MPPTFNPLHYTNILLKEQSTIQYFVHNICRKYERTMEKSPLEERGRNSMGVAFRLGIESASQ